MPMKKGEPAMKRVPWLLALALFLAIVGCTPKKGPGPNDPVPPTPVPVGYGNILGISRFALGPGLVVEGQTQQKMVRVELRNRSGAVLQQADVTPKDDGWWRLAWPDPNAEAEVVVMEGSVVLLRGALPTEINAGLFYAPDASAVRVDVVDPKAMTTLMVQGLVRSASGKVRLELRDAGKVLATHQLDLNKKAPEFGTIAAKVPLAPGAYRVHLFDAVSGAPIVTIPIVTH